MRPTSIALTGFMGSGKSTIGGLIASQLGWPFVDVDDRIEAVHSRSAFDLFRELGEAAFRATEARITAECLAAVDTVVALGGAAVDLPENQLQLTEVYRGSLVFLDGEFQELINRCLRQEQEQKATYRPLLHQPDKALSKFLLRRAWNLANADFRLILFG
jgi:shikimate kinase